MLKYVIALALIMPSLAIAQVFEHEGRTPLLIELYTSEGCSSCPEADDYMGVLKDDSELWKSIVPLAFHVDYWDFIGWKDELASPQFSERQREQKHIGALKAIYTPGWLVDGLEWRDYFRRAPFPDAPERVGGKLTADLSLAGNVKIMYQRLKGSRHNYEVNVALLGFDITNNVTAGENRGEKLIHQFVVLEHHNFSSEDDLEISLSKLDRQQKQALVVWVTPEGRYEPEQISSGWIATNP